MIVLTKASSAKTQSGSSDIEDLQEPGRHRAELVHGLPNNKKNESARELSGGRTLKALSLKPDSEHDNDPNWLLYPSLKPNLKLSSAVSTSHNLSPPITTRRNDIPWTPTWSESWQVNSSRPQSVFRYSFFCLGTFSHRRRGSAWLFSLFIDSPSVHPFDLVFRL